MDRVGLFQEMGYVTINDKYKERGGKLSSAIYFEAFFILKQFLNLDIRIYMCICMSTSLSYVGWKSSRGGGKEGREGWGGGKGMKEAGRK